MQPRGYPLGYGYGNCVGDGMMGRTGWIAATVLLSGCAGGEGREERPRGVPIPVEREEIRYETSPCFGKCPVYTLTVGADGRTTFEGKAHTAVTGTRVFDVGPSGFRQFAEALRPARPDGERSVQPGTPDCPTRITDQPGVDVRWQDDSGATAHLAFYYGCSRDQPALAEALRAAPDALAPLATYIGGR